MTLLKKSKIIISINTSWNLVNFRSGLIKRLVDEGFDVVAVAPRDMYSPQLNKLGCRYIALEMDNKGTHPGKDFLLLCKYFNLLRNERPDFYLSYTIKPNIYGSLAAHLLNIPVINNISGLGSAFVQRNWLNRLVRELYRLAIFKSEKVFFQNNEDKKLFVSERLVSNLVADCLPGSGIDLKRFFPVRLPNRAHVRFLMVARMLRDKGVVEFVEAAKILRERGVQAEFCLLGFLDVQSPNAISRAQMNDWVDAGIVSYLGVSDNVFDEIAQADCVVLPSYYPEGTPRTLLEAAAMARPIITTDSAGCRDVVDDGVNGYWCRPKDAIDLADKMACINSLSSSERESMGLLGRKKMEQQFDEQIVINKYVESLRNIEKKHLSGS